MVSANTAPRQFQRLADLPGMDRLWSLTKGAPEVRIAVLDGRVDTSHPCFAHARLETSPAWHNAVDPTPTLHGTHVTGVIFSGHHAAVPGVAPNCTGLLIPIFSAASASISQLDLARAVETALEAGVHVINLSGGQPAAPEASEDWLLRAVERCAAENVLFVAAAGNNSAPLTHLPAALPSVLAVGACDIDGRPLELSNWGQAYQHNGILAPGENIPGPRPGGGYTRMTCTSVAAPIVSGVAALLASIRLQQGRTPDMAAIRQTLLSSASPCRLDPGDNRHKCLVGQLNINQILEDFMNDHTPNIAPSSQSEGGALTQPPAAPPQVGAGHDGGITPSAAPSDLVYVIGSLGYDFATEARRDAFRQGMQPYETGGVTLPINPYDPRQMVAYLEQNPSAAGQLIWTFNLEMTPIYAVIPRGPFSGDLYQLMVALLAGETKTPDDPDYVDRLSMPGRLTGETIRLFSGQMVPVIAPESTRGIYGWETNRLVERAVEIITSNPDSDTSTADSAAVTESVKAFLNRIYYDFRNLGRTSPDRSLNFAATNVFQAAKALAEAHYLSLELDNIKVEKSPYCRMDSDCWDVKITFFDPENNRRARRVFRFTVDVSDLMPVTLGDVRTWSEP